MQTIRHILCPVDFAGGSRRALDYAQVLAVQHGASVVLLHVVAPSAGVPEESDERTLTRLSALAGAAAAVEHRIQTLCARGEPARRIVETASDIGADIIVMAPRAEPVVERLPLGSVTIGVTISAPCPVFVISAFATPQPAIQHVLCPLDFAEVDPVLVRYAADIARASSGTLTLLHIVDRHEELATQGEGSNTTERLERAALARLERIAAPIRADALSVDCLVDAGVASREILFTARAVAADLIVMGAQSRSGFELLSLGSTTHDVMSEALCPVAVMSRHVLRAAR
jgi:nucleotide-binding universal stress UspA family protein